MAKKLKDWFDRDCAARLGGAIAAQYGAFDAQGYATDVARGLEPLALKARVALMSEALRARLPADYSAAAAILSAALGPPLKGEVGMFTSGYWLMPVARLVEDHGGQHRETSLDLCEAITQRHTAEYAIRPYLEQHPSETLARVHRWTGHPNSHVRRLASEGLRPRLPWARRLSAFVEDPEPALAVATRLRADPSAYVRKSVANLINDVSKDHPERVVDLIRGWKAGASPETLWVMRHGTRTLRKQGVEV